MVPVFLEGQLYYENTNLSLPSPRPLIHQLVPLIWANFRQKSLIFSKLENFLGFDGLRLTYDLATRDHLRV